MLKRNRLWDAHYFRSKKHSVSCQGVILGLLLCSRPSVVDKFEFLNKHFSFHKWRAVTVWLQNNLIDRLLVQSELSSTTTCPTLTQTLWLCSHWLHTYWITSVPVRNSYLTITSLFFFPFYSLKAKRPFYSCVLSALALNCKRGWG